MISLHLSRWISNNPAYSSVGGVLFDKLSRPSWNIARSDRQYTIPGSVTSIGNSAFCSLLHLSGITIPTGVTNIGSEGFGFCFALTNLTIPSS